MLQRRACNNNVSRVTKLIQRETLENQLGLCHVDSIVSNVAVVPEFNYDGGLEPAEDYLVIQTRIQWLDYFYEFNRSNGAKSFPELFAAYSCTDEDEAFNKEESNNKEGTESEPEEDSSEIDTESAEDTSEEDTLVTTTQVRKTPVTFPYLTQSLQMTTIPQVMFKKKTRLSQNL